MSSAIKQLNADELEELQSNFLIESWSYSKVTTFARNEKAFEMNYIYGIRGRSSATNIAGKAYHESLRIYFEKKKTGIILELTDLEVVSFEYINRVESNNWKLQKTTPTVELCQKKATSTVASLLRNFISEKATYDDDIDEILEVEVYCNEFLTVNGVDVPLPCHGMIDLIVRTKEGKRAIIDHKSKSNYTSEDEIKLSIGVQAMTYILLEEARSGESVDEVWFVENKHSENKDKSAQLQNNKIILTDNTRRLYQALLYEPLRKLISAVNDPDYVYVINDADNYVDRAELYDFWAKTMISEVEDFNVAEAKKELVSKRLKKIRDASMGSITPKVIKEFKANAATFIQYDLSHTNMTPQEKIEHVLRSFGIIVKVAHLFEGYSSNTYLIEISAGIKIASIRSHRLDLANGLDVSTVRISNDLVVYEGKSYLAIELSKKRTESLLFDPSYLIDKKIPIGKDNLNNTIIWDLNNNSTPHVLICGGTGSGKSVSLRSTIDYTRLAGITEIIILDPKFEFTEYAKELGVCVVNDILNIEETMAALVVEMNNRVKSGIKRHTVIVFDEFADAFAQSRKGAELDIKEMVEVGQYAPIKDGIGGLIPGGAKTQLKKTGELKSLEENLRVLLQKGRSSGFRIIAATQRASTKVITGDAKVNFPVQICFRVQKEADSRVVLDEGGAEGLSGMGDGLIKSPEYPELVRFQAFYKPAS